MALHVLALTLSISLCLSLTQKHFFCPSRLSQKLKKDTFPVSYGGKRKVKIWEAMQPAQSVIIIDNLKAL